MDIELTCDLRGVPVGAGTERFLGCFDALAGARGFALNADTDRRDLLELLQDERPGQFEWYPLQDGPEEWHVVVAKRREGAPPQRQVLEFMTADHQRIFSMLAQLAALAREGDRGSLISLTDHLATALAKHITMEEEVLLPVVSLKLATPRGPAAVIRDEHLFVRDRVEALRAMARDDAPATKVAAAVEGLRAMLESHAGMEERILYAITDLLLAAEERDALVRRCQRF